MWLSSQRDMNTENILYKPSSISAMNIAILFLNVILDPKCRLHCPVSQFRNEEDLKTLNSLS